MPKSQRNSNYFSILGIRKLSPRRRGWQQNCLLNSGLGSLSLSTLKMTRVILWVSSEKWSPLHTSKSYLLRLSVSLSYWVPESLSTWQGEIHEGMRSMKQQVCSVTKSVSPDLEWATHSGRISEAFPFVPSKPPCETGKWGNRQYHFGLETHDLLQASEIAKLGLTHRYNIVCLI